MPSQAFRERLAECYHPFATPLLPMSEFLTVKQSSRLTGRSESSIRRLIYPIIADNRHPDRLHIEPGVEDVQRLRMKGENFPWKISREFLDRVAPPKPGGGTMTEKPHAGAWDDASLREVVTLLREQLQQTNQQLLVKDQQIATASEIIKSLNDRMREGNILMGTLQRQLSLTSGGPPPAAGTDNAAIEVTPPPPAPAPKTPKPAPKKPAKKGFFARVFR